MKRDRESISVIIPTFNRRELVCRAIESVMAQTTPANEIIVIDDGSTDGTSKSIRDRFPGIKLVEQPNLGVSAARNKGIQAASGSWIALLDSDDEWKPEKLAAQLNALANEPTYHLCHTNEIWIRNGRRVNPMKKHEKAGGWIFDRCLPLCAISPSSVLIRRTLFEEIGYFDESLPACEDYDLWLRVCSRHPVLFIDEPLVIKYGGHADQLSRKHWGMDRFRIRALKNIIESGSLEPTHRDAATKTLLEKIDIYLNGAEKRGRPEEREQLQALIDRYSV